MILFNWAPCRVAWVLHLIPPMQRFLVPGLFTVLAILAVSFVVDVLIVTDEERLEAFIDELTDDSPDRRVDSAIHLTDPSRVDVEVASPADRARYGDGEDMELADHLRDALASLDHGSLDVMQSTVHIEGDDGLAALRVDTAEGVVDAEFRFVRRSDGWLLRRVRVR